MKTEIAKIRLIPEFVPCKICGSEPVYKYKMRDEGWMSEYGHVSCSDCGVFITVKGESEEDTIQMLEYKWNLLNS
jgi:hypothetical protein